MRKLMLIALVAMWGCGEPPATGPEQADLATISTALAGVTVTADCENIYVVGEVDFIAGETLLWWTFKVFNDSPEYAWGALWSDAPWRTEEPWLSDPWTGTVIQEGTSPPRLVIDLVLEHPWEAPPIGVHLVGWWSIDGDQIRVEWDFSFPTECPEDPPGGGGKPGPNPDD